MSLKRVPECSLAITLQKSAAVVLVAELELDNQVGVTAVDFQHVHSTRATCRICKCQLECSEDLRFPLWVSIERRQENVFRSRLDKEVSASHPGIWDVPHFPASFLGQGGPDPSLPPLHTRPDPADAGAFRPCALAASRSDHPRGIMGLLRGGG